jgi:hypothetical protein
VTSPATAASRQSFPVVATIVAENLLGLAERLGLLRLAGR